MSVYRDTNTSVVFEHPHAGPLTATVYREGVVTPILTTTGLSSVGGKYTLPLTYTSTSIDGKLTIIWTATGFERKQRVDVVTPIVALSRLRTLYEDGNPSDAELSKLENTVRVVIESYTGQSFGYFEGAKTFIGTGGNSILFSQRLNKLIAFDGGWPGTLKIAMGGWSLIVIPEYMLGIKEAPPEEFLTIITTDVIRIPEWYVKRFNRGVTYTVTGEWGYDAVPEDVQEAAMLLANDFLCSESLYRDRYLDSIKIQQDTITYHPGAYRGTGNARADLLLERYIKPNLVII